MKQLNTWVIFLSIFCIFTNMTGQMHMLNFGHLVQTDELFEWDV